ncbi:MAG: FAD-dependent oxidoreductase [Deltaproteobacteria bacterium]|nr:FAD-dependent oxidoreductase [Deltaproteobacteria bacterium]
MEAVLSAIYMLGGLGLVTGALLAVASKVFYVYVDPKVMAVDDALPGANCGGCGLPGCAANAEAIVAGKVDANSCVAGGPEIAEAIAEIMGVTIEAKEPDIARPGCTYGVGEADLKYIYDGLSDCRAAALINGGMKVCTIGCLGLGSCEKACQFNAISMGPDGLPIVNEERCTGCGSCERVCPKNIIRLSSITRRILKEYTTEDCTTPCQRACPAGIDISEYIRQIALKNYHRAVQVIKERNPFPTVIGRICPRPCEVDCRRKYVDEPVAINFLKRFVADYEKETGERVLPYKAPDTGRKVAVIGGGIEGLSTSFFTARLGHQPTVFEATQKMGGLLRSAISVNRLSHDILDWDIEGIAEMGVAMETEKALGRDFTIDSLLGQGFDAIFLATGGWDSRLARGAGSMTEQLIPGTHLLLDFMRANNISGSNANGGISCESDVVINGGGKLAIDAAQMCKEKGAKNITLVFREKAEDFQEDDIQKIKDEGIKAVFNSGIRQFYGEGDSLTELKCVELDTMSETVIPAGTFIIASGRFPELVFIKQKQSEESEALEENSISPFKWVGVEPRKIPSAGSERGLLSDSDELSDYSAAIKAIGSGRRSAASIHQVMYDILPSLSDNVISATSVIQNIYSVENVSKNERQIMPLSQSDVPGDAELVENGYTEEMAIAESQRCLQCGLICYKKSEDTFIQEELVKSA